MAESLRVALIDDDSAVLDSLRLFFERNAIRVSCFSHAEAFLATSQESFDCIVADVRMPGLTGIDLMRELNKRESTVPVILITAHGDVEIAVSAIKLGVFDFLEKPFDEARLLECIRDAVRQTEKSRADAADLKELQERADSLSDRQRQVMELAATGLSNKEIATHLGISPRTVEIHRAWMMERMNARNLADLVRIAMRLTKNS